MGDETCRNEANKVMSFTRLPIFDSKQHLWGYELKHISRKNFSLTSEQENIASGAYMALQEILVKKKKIMMSFSGSDIIKHLPYALPPKRAVVKITETGNTNKELITAVKQLKDDGYQIAVAWAMDYKQNKSIFDMKDIICFDVSDLNKIKIAGLLHGNESDNVKLLANNIATGERFEICRNSGFELYQGSFFKQPENLSVKKLSSSAASRFQLLKVIEQNDPDFDMVAKVIGQDVAISFKLMSYLNSAAFGFRQKVETIKDAITMLGWRNMKNWLRVALLSDIAESRHSSELVFLSVQRGKFLEKVILDHDFWGFKPDSLFLLGMFSLLDAMLGQPMEEITKYLPLSGKIKKALCGDKNNEYYPLLCLAEYYEEAEWDKGTQMVIQLGLNQEKVEKALHLAIDWANKLEKVQN